MLYTIKYNTLLNELAEVCRRHNVFLVGTCNSEGIYGEVTIATVGDSAYDSYCNEGDAIHANVYWDESSQEASVSGIGWRKIIGKQNDG